MDRNYKNQEIGYAVAYYTIGNIIIVCSEFFRNYTSENKNNEPISAKRR